MLDAQFQDPNPYYGITLYSHGGLEVDMPISAVRVNYVDRPYG